MVGVMILLVQPATQTRLGMRVQNIDIPVLPVERPLPTTSGTHKLLHRTSTSPTVHRTSSSHPR